MRSETGQELVHEFLDHIKNQDWSQAKKLLSEDFEACWPQSNEKFDRDNYIEVNRVCPDTRKIQPMNEYSEHDQWDHTDTVIIESFIKSTTPEGKSIELFAISIFEVEDDGDVLIRSAREYWAETSSVPAWRKHLSTPYDTRGLKNE